MSQLKQRGRKKGKFLLPLPFAPCRQNGLGDAHHPTLTGEGHPLY